jgi:hypothetical protein
MMGVSLHASPEFVMVLCPIALAITCRKCPIFSVCPVKSVIGDYKPEDKNSKPAAGPKKSAKKK